MLPFVGVVDDCQRELFWSRDIPAPETVAGIYREVIGPFVTQRGAYWAVNYGALHPKLTIKKAERLALRFDKRASRPA